jgi:hypothetical protein
MDLWTKIRKRKSGVTTMWLALSLNTDAQVVALDTTYDVINNFDPMMTLIAATTTLMGTVDRPHFGLFLSGHKSKKHQHAPPGVLHMACGQTWWRFWPLAFTSKGLPNVVILAEGRDIVWIPHGWDHEVITLEGRV